MLEVPLPLDEPPARLQAEWQRLGLDPARCHVPPIAEVRSASNAAPARPAL